MSWSSGVCAEPWVLRKITERFRYQVRHVPHLPDVAITDFQRIHEHRYLPSLGEDRPIGRRYCGATVILSDGDGRDIWYLIEEGMGLLRSATMSNSASPASTAGTSITGAAASCARPSGSRSPRCSAAAEVDA